MKAWIVALPVFRERTLDGAGRGLDQECARITDTMRQTSAHGSVTSATKASYSARRVGRGATGAVQHNASVAAVNTFNAGHVATSTVRIDGELGVIIDSATDYQRHLETNSAGARAVLGPTLQSEAGALTAAAARGSREALR